MLKITKSQLKAMIKEALSVTQQWKHNEPKRNTSFDEPDFHAAEEEESYTDPDEGLGNLEYLEYKIDEFVTDNNLPVESLSVMRLVNGFKKDQIDNGDEELIASFTPQQINATAKKVLSLLLSPLTPR